MIPRLCIGKSKDELFKVEAKERERHTYMETDFDAIVLETEEAGT